MYSYHIGGGLFDQRRRVRAALRAWQRFWPSGRSVDDLARQVSGNKVVAKRYSNYFNMTPTAFPSIFAPMSRSPSCKKPMKANVHFIGKKTGRIYSKDQGFARGTKVFRLVGWESFDGPEMRQSLRADSYSRQARGAREADGGEDNSSAEGRGFRPPPVAAPAPVEVAMLPLVAPAIAAPPLRKRACRLARPRPLCWLLGRCVIRVRRYQNRHDSRRVEHTCPGGFPVQTA